MNNRVREIMMRPSAALLTGPAACDDATLAAAVRPRRRSAAYVPAETRITVDGRELDSLRDAFSQAFDMPRDVLFSDQPPQPLGEFRCDGTWRDATQRPISSNHVAIGPGRGGGRTAALREVAETLGLPADALEPDIDEHLAVDANEIARHIGAEATPRFAQRLAQAIVEYPTKIPATPTGLEIVRRLGRYVRVDIIEAGIDIGPGDLVWSGAAAVTVDRVSIREYNGRLRRCATWIGHRPGLEVFVPVSHVAIIRRLADVRAGDVVRLADGREVVAEDVTHEPPLIVRVTCDNGDHAWYRPVAVVHA